jgi:hypothetical protein
MGNVTANADGKSMIKVVKWDMENNTLTTTTVVPSKVEKMTDQKWETTRSISSDSQDVSNSVSSEELWRMTSSTVIPSTVTSETIVNVDTAIINVDTVSDVVIVTPTTTSPITTTTTTTSITEVESVTEESTTTNVIMLNSVNKK